MTNTWLFIASFAVTLVLLACVIVTGKLALRKRHITLVVVTVASLGVTVWFAEKLGHEYDLASAGAITPIHLAIAKAATGSFLLPVATGIATTRRPELVRWHRPAAYFAIVLTVLAAITGTAMVMLSDPAVVAG